MNHTLESDDSKVEPSFTCIYDNRIIINYIFESNKILHNAYETFVFYFVFEVYFLIPYPMGIIFNVD